MNGKQRSASSLYLFTIIAFLFITAAGLYLRLWRGDDLKFILILFLLVVIGLRLDDLINLIDNRQKETKPAASDLYMLDVRLQSIIQSLEDLNHSVERLVVLLPEEPERPQNTKTGGHKAG